MTTTHATTHATTSATASATASTRTGATDLDGDRSTGADPRTVTFPVSVGWPTPDHCRRTADGLDAIGPARYGDILRTYADAEDARFAQYGPVRHHTTTGIGTGATGSSTPEDAEMVTVIEYGVPSPSGEMWTYDDAAVAHQVARERGLSVYERTRTVSAWTTTTHPDTKGRP